MKQLATVALLLFLVLRANGDVDGFDVAKTADEIELVADCASRISDCQECTKNVKCLWCSSAVIQCVPYPAKDVIPSSEVCDLEDANWGVCFMSFRALLITLGCVTGGIILSIIGCICCCCCCCCRKATPHRISRTEECFEQERQQRSTHQAERRAERQTRLEEIRHKYGLLKDSEPVYERFENEA